MIIRFLNVKDTHSFITRFKKMNPSTMITMRGIKIEDNNIKCIISARGDNFDNMILPEEVNFQVLDKDAISYHGGPRLNTGAGSMDL